MVNLTANSKFYATDKKERKRWRESKTPQGRLGEIKQTKKGKKKKEDRQEESG
jgi:hypothetical protein